MFRSKRRARGVHGVGVEFVDLGGPSGLVADDTAVNDRYGE